MVVAPNKYYNCSYCDEKGLSEDEVEEDSVYTVRNGFIRFTVHKKCGNQVESFNSLLDALKVH